MATRELTPMLKRADEIDAHHPLMAYYCRLRAVELGMALPSETRPQKLLASALEKLERAKPKAGLVDADVDFKVCRDFALRVYARADRADRAGKADARLADAFSAAATFLKARPTSHWSPYDRVGVVNADP